MPEIMTTESFWAPIIGAIALFFITAIVMIDRYRRPEILEGNMEKTYRILKAKPTTLIIHCSDPRFHFAFNCFFMNDLNLASGEFVQIVVAGGPASLANPAMAKEMQFLNIQIVFFLKHFTSIKSVVLINHEDCGFYKLIPNPTNKKENRERDDALVAAKATADRIFSEGIGDIEVSAFYAKFANTDRSEIVFKKM